MKARRLVLRLAATLALAVLVSIADTGSITAATVDWSQYLGGPLHSSTSPATAITTANAAALHRKWIFHADLPTMTGQPAPVFNGSPTISGGRVFIGSDTGEFYALNETTGAMQWKAFLGFEPALTCASGRGIDSTAAVALDPVSGLPVVYVAGGDGYLYALDAASGSQLWKAVIALPSPTANDYYDWSSPTVVDGKVYVGIASECDVPLIRGGVAEFDQETGSQIGSYFAVPATAVGGGVWSSVAVTPSAEVFVTTGNAAKKAVNDGQSIVSLNGGSGLARLDGWRVPATQISGDDDFGASPTIFSANIGGVSTQMVGACNKNGLFYALRTDGLASGPVWTFRVAAPSTGGSQACLAAATWDGSHLYIASGSTVINGTTFAGAVRMLDPNTGTPVWETGLNSVVLGSTSIDGAGVLAAATYGKGVTDGVYLINASTGAILAFIASGKEFSQPVFADGFLLFGSKNNLRAYGP